MEWAGPGIDKDSRTIRFRNGLLLSFAEMNDITGRLPKSEVDYFYDVIRVKQDRWMTAQGVVINRLDNPICNHCGDKSNIRELRRCIKCGMTWYCGDECEEKDQAAHGMWCCKADAARDMGLLRSN